MSDLLLLISAYELLDLIFFPLSCSGREVRYNYLNWISVLEEIHVSIYFTWTGVTLKNNKDLYSWLFKWKVGFKNRNWFFSFFFFFLHNVEVEKRSKADVYYHYISVKLFQDHYSKHITHTAVQSLIFVCKFSPAEWSKTSYSTSTHYMSNFLLHLSSSFLYTNGKSV